MKRIGVGVVSAVAILALVVGLSHRNLRELAGYVRASADQTVDGLEQSVPNSVRDQKLKNDIDQARGDIIDRRVKLNLAASEIRRLQSEIETLAAAVKRRETILKEAYPALEAGAKDRVTKVTFAGTEWLPTELGAEIDRLLMEQDRDDRQLEIRREAMTRLVKSIEDGSTALAQMEAKLLDAENEFNTLVVRREQAENENELLDLVASVGRTGSTPAAQIGTTLEGLRGDVQKLEARNDARRETVPSTDRDTSRLSQAWTRLERLKKLHDQSSETSSDAAVESAGAKTQKNDAKSTDKNVIIVIKDSQVEPAETKEAK